MSAVPLAEVKQHLQMSADKTNNNVELQRFIDTAETAIGHRVGPLVPVEVAEKHDGGTSMIVLRRPRAVSLTSVSYADGASSTLGDYDLDADTGILYWNYGTTGRFAGSTRNVTVTYVAGWAELPEDLRQAVKELVRHLWETQRGGGSGTRAPFPGDDLDQAAPAGAFSSWPIRVQELIAPYMVPAVA